MSVNLPFVMQQLFNRPQYLSIDSAQMIAAVVAGKMDIQSLVSDSEVFNRRDMEDLTAMGRMEARQAVEQGRWAPADMQMMPQQDAAHPGVARHNSNYTPYEVSKSGIALIPVEGVLKRKWGIGPYSGATGYDGIWAQLLHAVESEYVKAILFTINSGGGAVDGLFDLADAIYANSERLGGKPIWAMAADHAYSAAYAIAAACDRVFVPALGGVGSIGSVIIHMEMSQLLEESGVKATIIRSKPGKFRGNDLEALDDETLGKFQQIVDEADEFFVDRVSAFRGISKKAIHETNAGVYTGREALATGLVNEVLSEPEVWMKLEQYIA